MQIYSSVVDIPFRELPEIGVKSILDYMYNYMVLCQTKAKNTVYGSQYCSIICKLLITLTISKNKVFLNNKTFPINVNNTLLSEAYMAE